MRRALLTLSSAVLIACSEGTSGGSPADEFAAALNAYYADNPECVRVADPADEAGVIAEIMQADIKRDRRVSRLEALVDIGLLEVRVADVEVETFRQSDPTTAAARQYVLTDDGRGALQPAEKASRGRRAATAFCYGHRQVDAIKTATEPADALGVRTVNVRYAYELADVPGWALSARMADAFPEIASTAEGLQEGSAELVLTDRGWVHSSAAP